MAPPDTIWHKESLKLKEIFGTREGFEICPHQLSPGPIKASVGTGCWGLRPVNANSVYDSRELGQWLQTDSQGKAPRSTTRNAAHTKTQKHWYHPIPNTNICESIGAHGWAHDVLPFASLLPYV